MMTTAGEEITTTTTSSPSLSSLSGGGGGGGSDSEGMLSTMKAEFSELQSTFDGLDQHIDRQKRSQREAIERQLAQLKEDIEKTQAIVVLEKRTHAQSMKAMQTWLETQTQMLIERIETPLLAKLDQLMVKVDTVNTRVADLEVRLDSELARLPGMIDDRADALLTEIQAFEGRFEHAASERQRIEENIVSELQRQEVELNAKIEEETNARALRDAELNNEITHEVSTRERAVERLWTKYREDVVVLRESIAQEVKTRAAADTELVNAIKTSTKQLTDSIRHVADQQ